MSTLRYNNITLPYVVMNDYTQEATYDDMGGTGFYLTRFDITCQTVLNSAYLRDIAPDLLSAGNPVTTNAADIMDAIRSRLLQPRKLLSIKTNGVELIPKVATNTGTVDSRNGPQPQSCVIVQLTNVTFLCVYHIVAYYWEKTDVDPNGSPIVRNLPANTVLYNRWSETADIDNCNYTKRTREGKIIIRSDNRQGIIADQVREQMAVLGVFKGFIRESAQYTVAPDGLALQYRIVDREVFKKPPVPAFEASGEYVENTTRAGAVRYGSVRVRLKGQKTTDQAQLIVTAVNVGMSKLNLNGARNILESASVYVDLYDNVVEFNARMMFKPGTKGSAKRRIKGCATLAAGDEMTKTPFSDGEPFYLPEPMTRGTAGLLLQAAAYYDPNLLQNEVLRATGQLTNGVEVGRAGVNLEV